MYAVRLLSSICTLFRSVNFIKTLKAVNTLKTAQKYINANDYTTAKIHLEKTIKIKKPGAPNGAPLFLNNYN